MTLTANKTTLSGDLNNDDQANFAQNGENAYHVVVAVGSVGNAELNGFIITSGNANGNGSSIMVNYQTIGRNSGGGQINFTSSPTIVYCTFTNNTSKTYGGGLYNVQSSSKMFNNIFLGNKASDGGGVYNADYSAPIIMNTIFSGNSAILVGGGAMYNNSVSIPFIYNCTFSGNKGADGGAIFNAGLSFPRIKNTIIIGNSSGVYNASTSDVSSSLIQGISSTANGNLHATGVGATDVFTNAPNFSGAPFTTGDYSLLATSVVVNKGYKTIFNAAGSPDLSAITKDLANNPRIFGTQIDMGAYELQSAPVLSVADFNGDKKITAIRVYPVPTKGAFTVAYVAKTYQKLVLIDYLGKVLQIKNIETSSTSETLSLSEVATGIYFVKLVGSNLSEVVKVIKN